MFPWLCGKLSPVLSCHSYVMTNICLLANSWVIENSICWNSRPQNNVARNLSPPPAPTLQPGPSVTGLFWGALQCTDCLEEVLLDGAREETFGFIDSDVWMKKCLCLYRCFGHQNNTKDIRESSLPVPNLQASADLDSSHWAWTWWVLSKNNSISYWLIWCD